MEVGVLSLLNFGQRCISWKFWCVFRTNHSSVFHSFIGVFFMRKVAVWHFESDTHKVVSALILVVVPSTCCCGVFFAISKIWVEFHDGCQHLSECCTHWCPVLMLVKQGSWCGKARAGYRWWSSASGIPDSILMVIILSVRCSALSTLCHVPMHCNSKVLRSCV